MAEWLAIAMALLLGPFLIGPLVVYGTLRVASQPKHACIDMENPYLPRQFVEHVAAVQYGLYPAGFNLAGAAACNAAWPVVRFVAIFEHPARHTIALAALQISHSAACGATSLTFLSAAVDGTYVQTDNDISLQGCPGLGNPARLSVPGMRDSQLLALHQNRTADMATVRMAMEEPAAVAAAMWIKPFYAQYADDLLQMDDEHLRPTWKGAVLTAWRHMGWGGLLQRFTNDLRAASWLRPARQLAQLSPSSS